MALEVSIHAPTWGATYGILSGGQYLWFQSTHPRGVRPTYLSQSVTPSRFQSTHPRGVRHGSRMRYVRTACFNPRTHVGCDWRAGGWLSIASKFQSTHPRGVRRTVAVCVALELLVSIHAPTWGATRVPPSDRCTLCCFNPRTHVGCDVFVWSKV